MKYHRPPSGSSEPNRAMMLIIVLAVIIPLIAIILERYI